MEYFKNIKILGRFLDMVFLPYGNTSLILAGAGSNFKLYLRIFY